MQQRDPGTGDPAPAPASEPTRREVLAYAPPTLIAVTSAPALTPPPSMPVSISGVTPASGVYTTPVTITGANFDPVLKNNLVTFVDLVNRGDAQLDLTSVTDANTQLDGTVGQLSTATSAPVRVHTGTGGDLPSFIYAAGSSSTSFNVDGFAMNPGSGSSSTGCGTAACDGFGLLQATPQTGNAAATAGSISFDMTGLGPWSSSETGTVRAYLGTPRTVVEAKFNFSPSSTLTVVEAADHVANHLTEAFRQVENQFASVYNLAPGVNATSGGTSVIQVTAAAGLAPISWVQVSKA